MGQLKHNFKNNSAKSYASIKNAEKALEKIKEDIADVDAVNWLKYVFTVNEENRIQIMFLIDNRDFNNFFHYCVHKGHLVQAL